MKVVLFLIGDAAVSWACVRFIDWWYGLVRPENHGDRALNRVLMVLMFTIFAIAGALR